MIMTGHGSGAGDGVGGYLEGKTTRSWLLIGNTRKNTNYYYFVVRLFNFERWISLGLVLDRYVCDALISSKGGCLNYHIHTVEYHEVIKNGVKAECFLTCKDVQNILFKN